MRMARQAGVGVWIVVVLLLGAGALIYADVRVIRVARNVPVPAQFGASSTWAGSDLIFTWNPACPSLRSAENADAFIEDGSHRMRLLLLPGQLAAGSIQYTPFTNDVGFRLVAHGPDGRAAQESIRIVGSAAFGTFTQSRDPGVVTIRVAPTRVVPTQVVPNQVVPKR
jgi:hypothetical protein